MLRLISWESDGDAPKGILKDVVNDRQWVRALHPVHARQPNQGKALMSVREWKLPKS